MKRLIAVLMISLVALTSCSSSDGSTQSDTSSSQTEETTSFNTEETAPDTSWIPEGFNDYDGNIAWRWVERESDCSDCIYWHVQVISNYGCPNGVYGSINIERNDEVIDWTNDSIPYLAANQKAVLAFEKYGLSGSGSNYQGSLTELNCR